MIQAPRVSLTPSSRGAGGREKCVNRSTGGNVDGRHGDAAIGVVLCAHSALGLCPGGRSVDNDIMRRPATSHRWLVVVPNVLSAIRLGLAIGFVFMPRAWWPIVILIAAATDFTDGYIARRFDASSWAGGLLDAVADKGFTLAVLIAYVIDERLTTPMVLILLARDFSVTFVAAYAAATGRWHAFKKMPSRLPGKLTTAAMFVLIFIVAIGPQRLVYTMGPFVVTVTLSVWAAIDYFILFLRGLAGERAEQSPP